MAGTAVWSAAGREVAWHYAIRHRVFVGEQGALVLTDMDAHDRDPAVIHVVGSVDDRVAGAVRLYPLEGDLWQGDRLAVLPGCRATSLGALLVRFAVASAASVGGHRMVAHIQPSNVRFFQRLGWHVDGEAHDYLGLPHQPMAIDLRTAPPFRGIGRPVGAHLEPAPAEPPSPLVESTVGSTVVAVPHAGAA